VQPLLPPQSKGSQMNSQLFADVGNVACCVSQTIMNISRKISSTGNKKGTMNLNDDVS